MTVATDRLRSECSQRRMHTRAVSDAVAGRITAECGQDVLAPLVMAWARASCRCACAFRIPNENGRPKVAVSSSLPTRDQIA